MEAAAVFRNWEYIYQVYREKSFSRAAEKLHIAQPSLSLTVKKAEERAGAPVFDRSTTPLRLTEFGEKYIEAVEIIRKLQNELEDYIYDTNELRLGHVSIGASNFHSAYILPPVLSLFRKKYPGIQLDLYESSTSDFIQKLAAGALDLAVTNMELDESSYKRFPLFKEKMILAVPSAMLPRSADEAARLQFDELCREDVSRPCVSLAGFTHLPFVLLKPGNSSRTIADKLFAAAGASPNVTLELDQAATMYRIAALGIGAAIVSDVLAKKAGLSEDMAFFKLGDELSARYIYMYARAGSPISRAAAAFIETACEYLPENLR